MVATMEVLDEAAPAAQFKTDEVPPHGARDYKNGHRCSVCRAAIAKVNADYRKRRASREPIVRVDAEPARQHVQALFDRGMPLLAIARRARVPKETLVRLLGLGSHSPTRVLEEGRAKRIRRVDYDPMANWRGVPAIGAKRRIEALHCNGWAFRRLVREIGTGRDSVKLIVNGTWSTITPELHRTIAAFYEQNRLVDGQDPTAKQRALERGYVPADGWTGSNIDDWRSEPTIEAARARAHVLELFDDRNGMPLPVIAERAQVSKQMMYRLLYGCDGATPTERLTVSRSERILAVKYDPLPKGYGANAIGVKRRLEALYWKGWNWQRLAREIPLHNSVIAEVLAGTQPTVRWVVHYRVAAFYEKYWLTDGGDEDAKRRARQRRFVPPGGWGTHTIDDWRAEHDPGVDWAA